MDSILDGIRCFLNLQTITNAEMLSILLNALIVTGALSGIYFSNKSLKKTNELIELNMKSVNESVRNNSLLEEQIVDSIRPLIKPDFDHFEFMFDKTLLKYKLSNPKIRLANIGKGMAENIRITIRLGIKSKLADLPYVAYEEHWGIAPFGIYEFENKEFIEEIQKFANENEVKRNAVLVLLLNVVFFNTKGEMFEKMYDYILNYSERIEEDPNDGTLNTIKILKCIQPVG